MTCFYIVLWSLLFFTGISSGKAEAICFPKGFQFGVATAAYQIEGAWNVSGRTESIWDKFSHDHPERIFDGSNGDVADNSYYLYKRDVEMVKELGANFYRISISWTRVLPTGYTNYINPDGVRYYRELIDEIRRNGLTPMVTMYHWDLPQTLQDLGGWTNPEMAEYFKDFARVLLDTFGDDVPVWITINEPLSICLNGYGRHDSAPGHNSSGIEAYLCGHNLLRAHAMVYRMFDREYRYRQNNTMGIVMSCPWIEPASKSQADTEAAKTALQFMDGWFSHPIFSTQGDYPLVMRKRIDEISSRQNYSRSRLPSFTEEEIESLIGSSDFMGYNHYTSLLASKGDEVINIKPSFADDMGVYLYADPNWPKTNATWLRVVPWGFRKLVNYIKATYNNPPVFITENGVPFEAGLRDIRRISYMDSYLRNLHAAITQDGCNVLAYTYWSLMDNYEWNQGYAGRFGLYEVNYTTPQRTRTPRLSAEYFTKLATTNCLPEFDLFKS